MEASGVRSSCETLAMKSRRICSVRLTSVRSLMTTSEAHSPPPIIGAAVTCSPWFGRSTRSTLRCPSSRLRRSPSRTFSFGITQANGFPTSSSCDRMNNRSAATFANAIRPSAPTATTASLLLFSAACKRLRSCDAAAISS
ncbi:MAG: hypothetical protein A2148_08305 [Chloroflexi bacterium RBG_16_68_14]|nr:MAG: hypothetical protein A2148_08305 [Chloroflexi bacterium RBG_16_68_14]